MKVNIALVLSLGLFASSAFAQDLNAEVVKDKEALEKFGKGENRFPPRPSDMWELGIHAGHFAVAGDVQIRPGFGLGLHLRKAIGYALSLRLDGMYGQAKGMQYRPLGNQVLAIGGSQIGQIGSNPVIRNLTDSKGQRYSNSNPYYLKYKTDYYQVSVQGLFNLGNLLFHKPSNKWGVYMGPGLGLNVYQCRYDAKDASGMLYTYNASELAKHDVDLFAGRDARLDYLKKVMSEEETATAYETVAEKSDGRVDPLFAITKRRTADAYTSGLVFPVSAGVSYKLSKRVNVSLEHTTTFSDDDLIDGQRWMVTGAPTQNKDFPQYTNVRLALNLGSFKNKVEPLYWRNPLESPLADLQKAKKINPDDFLKDDDNDGVANLLDKEPDTPAGSPVNTRGQALDSDNDGVKDANDDEPFTAPGCPVNARGVGQCKVTNIDCSVCGGNSWFLPSVHFDNNSYCVKDKYYADLKNVASVLSKNPKICVTVTGYTDDGQSGEYNRGLSYNRAKSVADFLVNNYGVDRSRVAVKIGGQEALAKGAAASNFANRRVEIETAACGTGSDSAPANAATSGTNVCAPEQTTTTIIQAPPVENVTPTPIRVNKGLIKR